MQSMTRLVAVLLIVSGMMPARGFAETVMRVESPATLQDALTQLQGQGGTILLAAGDYGALFLQGGGGTVAQPLVIRAANPDDPGRFVSIDLREVAHLVMEDVQFDYRFADGDPIHVQPFRISDSRDVTLRNTLFDGDDARSLLAVDDGFANGIGLGVRGSSGILIENSEFRTFHRGMGISESQDVTLRGNDIHDMRSDGMNLAQVTGVLIEDNHFHDFRRSLDSTDHADMIQFWTTGTTEPSTDIVIRNNVLNSGRGWYTQSIFMRNELVDQGQAGPEMFYRDITITQNVIINAHLHGITVGETDGLVIANNTLIENAGSKTRADQSEVWTPRINVVPNARNVRITRNIMVAVAGWDGQADWVVADNVTVQNRTRAHGGFYDTVFVAAITGDPRDLASFAYRRDGPLAGAGVGAARLDRP
jgi:hypothetical protein